MKLRENSFLTAIRAGQKQLGLWVSLSNGYAAEVVAHAGYDWVMLDMEHAPSDMASVLGSCRRSRAVRPRRWCGPTGTMRSRSNG